MARSETATTTSVAITLWMNGMCLSPIPWMLCSPNPLRSIVAHSSASTATVSEPACAFRKSPAAMVPAEPVAETNARSRSPGCFSRIASYTPRSADPVAR